MLLSENISRLLKVIIVGNAGIGKTALTNRVKDGTYPQKYVSSRGFDFFVKNVQENDELVAVQWWEMDKQEISSARSNICNGEVSIVLVAVDATEGMAEAIRSYQDFYNEAKRKAPNAKIVLTFTKTDHDSVQAHAKGNGQDFLNQLKESEKPDSILWTSAKNGEKGEYSLRTVKDGRVHDDLQTGEICSKEFIFSLASMVFSDLASMVPVEDFSPSFPGGNANNKQSTTTCHHPFHLTARLWQTTPTEIKTFTPSWAFSNKGSLIGNVMLSVAFGAAAGAAIGALAGFMAFGPAGMLMGAAIGAGAGAAIGLAIGALFPKCLPNLASFITRALLTTPAVLADTIDTIIPCVRPIESTVNCIAGPARPTSKGA